MAKQKRGSYRSINTMLLDDEDFQRLSPLARHVYNTLRLSRINNLPGIFLFDDGEMHTIAKQAGLPVEQVPGLLCELESGNWIKRHKRMLWVRNQLRFDPHADLDDVKIRKGIQNIVDGMSPCALLEEFCAYYGFKWPFKVTFSTNQLALEPVEGPCMGHTRPIDGPLDSHRLAIDVQIPDTRIQIPDSGYQNTDTGKEGLTADRRHTVEDLREKVAQTKPKPQSEHQEFIAYFKSEFDRRFADQELVYVFEGAKDGECVRRLLGRVKLEKAKEVAHYLIWDCEDSWIAKIGGYKISTLLSQLNSLLQQMARVQPRAAPKGGPPRLQGNLKSAHKALEILTDGRHTVADEGRLGDGQKGRVVDAIEFDHSGQV